MTSQEAYKILGLSPEADSKTIKERYRHLCQTYHPDHNPDVDPKVFSKIQEAYETLTSKPKKEKDELETLFLSFLSKYLLAMHPIREIKRELETDDLAMSSAQREAHKEVQKIKIRRNAFKEANKDSPLLEVSLEIFDGKLASIEHDLQMLDKK
jgi:curved DNA-binding protein CbpA